jgi:predicted glycosyltransferase involved in capsule biosynthesis
MRCLRKVWRWLFPRQAGKGISLLVPFRSDGQLREETWSWLRQYYTASLPLAEIVLGCDDDCDPFSKTMAMNDAASRASGDIFVLLDADCLIKPDVIEDCAGRIRRARRRGHPLWFIPYRRFYRLNRVISRVILDIRPDLIDRDPAKFLGDPPDPSLLDDCTNVSSGHHWGALIQIMPREAFELVGGMDPRFRSWGSEDVSFMWAVDALYGRHRTSNNPVYHLWHPTFGGKLHTTRFWKGGEPRVNDALATRYRAAIGNRLRMRRLVDEGFKKGKDNG